MHLSAGRLASAVVTAMTLGLLAGPHLVGSAHARPLLDLLSPTIGNACLARPGATAADAVAASPGGAAGNGLVVPLIVGVQGCSGL